MCVRVCHFSKLCVLEYDQTLALTCSFWLRQTRTGIEELSDLPGSGTPSTGFR